MFTDWPTRELPGLIKFYILGQWAFWLQQLIIVNIEERRKDHLQMVAHHLVTILLIYTSYTLHLTRVANVILVLMDVVDIFFPVSDSPSDSYLLLTLTQMNERTRYEIHLTLNSSPSVSSTPASQPSATPCSAYSCSPGS
jgi:hypothetical protein